MKATLPNIRKLAGRGRTENSANSGDINTNEIANNEAAEPKPPPPLPMFFMLSHLEEDGPVRLDGVKLAVLEVMGLELDEPKLGAFAGSLNALDFPVQLLVSQHPPVLQTLRNTLAEAQPDDLPQQTRDAAESPWVGCSPDWRPARASWTGASTPCANTPAPTSCGACCPAPGWACSP